MQNENWLPVAGYEGLYDISSMGRVKSLSRDVAVYQGSKKRTTPEKILAVIIQSRGYQVVTLSKDDIHKRYRVHRLVSMAFIPNPKGYKEVNHKDGNKLNNSVDNLEWCNRSQNIKHGYDSGLKMGRK